METLHIATRKSPLALRQAEIIAAALQARHPQLRIRMQPMTTRGDAVHDRSLAALGGKGLFIRELEKQLLDGRADIAVHSMKDVPAQLPRGLAIAAVTAREDPSDAFLSNSCAEPAQLRAGAVVGTASLRRRFQLKHHYPQIEVRELRGNVGTRLRKLDAGEYDAIILASAGLKRLGLTSRIRRALPYHISLPAIGQGVLGLECRDDDEATRALIGVLNDADTDVCIQAERALSRGLGADCRMPLAGYATLDGDTVRLRALLGDENGTNLLHDERSAPKNESAALGTAAAEALLAQGAAELIAAY